MTSPILQFGTSRFLQAHFDLFVDQGFSEGSGKGQIAVVQTTHSQESAKRLEFFNSGKPYIIKVQGLSGETEINEEVPVASIGRGVDANSDWPEVERLFVEEARWVASNTGDRGYELFAGDEPSAARSPKLSRETGKAAAGAVPRRRQTAHLFPLRAHRRQRRQALRPCPGDFARLGLERRIPALRGRTMPVGQFARRPHRLRAARARRRSRRAVCAVGGRESRRARHALRPQGCRRHRRPQALRAPETVSAQSEPHLHGGTLGSGGRPGENADPRVAGKHGLARRPRRPRRARGAAGVRRARTRRCGARVSRTA